MNPLSMFILAILSPALMGLALLGPIYAGLCGAAYVIYYKPEHHPLAGKFSDVSYIIDVYGGLYSAWAHHMSEMAFLSYTLPLLALPIGGLLLGFFITNRMAVKLKNIFHAGVSY